MSRRVPRWSLAASASLLLLAHCGPDPFEGEEVHAEPEDGAAQGAAAETVLAQVTVGRPTPPRFGTVRGRVLDARDGQPIASGRVVAVAACEGAGCGATPTATITGGAFVFDAYAASPQRLLLTDDTAFTIEDPSNRFAPVSIAHGSLQYASRSGQNVTELPTVYVCPTGAVDSDRDGICDLAEARYQTNPNLADSDRDALTDQDELYGHATTAGRRYNIRQLGADPRHRDVFVEIDHVSRFPPNRSALDLVVAAFKSAPLPNPDGTQGVSLRVFVDQALTGTYDDNDLDPAWVDYDTIKGANFNEARQFAFHYAIWGNRATGGRSGWARNAPATDFMVTLGNFSPPGGTVLMQAGTFMHELGHDLGLLHGNTDDDNDKPHYMSVMNYRYQFAGVRRKASAGSAATDVFDYGRIAVQGFHENALNEQAAFAPGPGTDEPTLALYDAPAICTARDADGECTTAKRLKGTLSSNLDFNGDNVVATTPVSVDLNADKAKTAFPAVVSDWGRMIFHGGGVIGAAGSPRPPRTYNVDLLCPKAPVVIN